MRIYLLHFLLSIAVGLVIGTGSNFRIGIGTAGGLFYLLCATTAHIEAIVRDYLAEKG